ncbi:MAG: pilus assembly protein PilO [Chroococcidiopsidaceae cyanobacterium CP_BM_RX_35]|nr:pilus assembly protein PilO [Chroococcidiopsidaceae cyanobacterium CP_BM_RX_35]
MTVSEDFVPFQKGKMFGAEPRYPTLFGLTLTPNIISILVMMLGTVGFFYLVANQVMPAWQKHQEMEASQVQKQTQIQQAQTKLAQSQQVRAELAQAKQQQLEVLSLFSNENTLDTLALDLNRLAETINASLGSGVKAKLTKYEPVADPSNGAITDGSLGPEVNGKLKSRAVNIAFEGTFEETETILRDIERLQSLLIVKDFQSTLPQTPLNLQGKGPQTITTSFQLQALIPLSPEESAKATAAAQQPQK